MTINPESLRRNAVIIEYFQQGWSQREISKKMNVPKTTIQNVINNYVVYKTDLRIPGSGRRTALKERDISFVEGIVDKNPKISAPKLASLLTLKKGIIVSASTIARTLQKIGFYSRVPRKIPLFSSKNITERHRHSLTWTSWSLAAWQKILFTDETKINVFSSDGRERIWRKQNSAFEIKNCVPTIKHGRGSIMVWGCMSYNGVGKLVIIRGTMDRFVYKQILAENLEISRIKLGLSNDFKFQQDNDPKHKSKYVMDYFKENNIDVISWPSQSPDMNPIEHLWDYVKREVRKYQPLNTRQLEEIIIKIWDSIPAEFCQKLINSMPQRVMELARANGGPTRF